MQVTRYIYSIVNGIERIVKSKKHIMGNFGRLKAFAKHTINRCANAGRVSFNNLPESALITHP